MSRADGDPVERERDRQAADTPDGGEGDHTHPWLSEMWDTRRMLQAGLRELNNSRSPILEELPDGQLTRNAELQRKLHSLCYDYIGYVRPIAVREYEGAWTETLGQMKTPPTETWVTLDREQIDYTFGGLRDGVDLQEAVYECDWETIPLSLATIRKQYPPAAGCVVQIETPTDPPPRIADSIPDQTSAPLALTPPAVTKLTEQVDLIAHEIGWLPETGKRRTDNDIPL